LFGEDSSKEIPAEEKAKRLREESRAELERILESTIQSRFPAKPAKHGAGLVSAYVQRAVEEIGTNLRQSREQLIQQRASRQAPFDRNAKILTAMAELDTVADRVATAVEDLAKQEEAMLEPKAAPAEQAGVDGPSGLFLIPQITVPLLV
jgi:hypothetical protein